MKNSTRLLSPKLYKEGLRQLRVVGLLFGILGAGLPLVQIIVAIAAGTTGYGSTKVVLSDFTQPSFVLFAFMAVFALIAVLYLFSFLNKRGSSDFYHALPASRRTLYFSFAASILTWVWGVGIVALSLLVAVALIAGVPLTLGMALMSYGLLLSATLFVVAAALAAVSITGMWLSSVAVAGLIVCIPYLVTKSFFHAVLARVPSIPAEFAGSIGGVTLHNTFFLLSVQRAAGISNYGAATYGASIVVTFIWSLILICAGAWFFKRRKSEMAGTSAPGKGFQLAYRVALSVFAVVFIMNTYINLGATVINSDGLAASSSLATSLSALVIPLIVALVVFLVFEFVTTRKLSRLLRALPSFGLVLAFIAVFYGAVALYSAYEKRVVPAASQIASVRILSTEYNLTPTYPPVFDALFMVGNGQTSTYNQICVQGLTIKSTAMLQATADKLQAHFDPNYDTNDGSGRTTMLIEARTKGGRTVRRLIDVHMDDQHDGFSQAMLHDPEVVKALTTLPKPGTVILSTSGDLFMFSNSFPLVRRVSQGEKQQVYREAYRLFYDEYQKLSLEERYQITFYGALPAGSTEATTIADFTRGGNVRTYGKVGAQRTEDDYSFATPKASAYYWKMMALDVLWAFEKNPSQAHVDQIDCYSPLALRELQGTTTLTTSNDPLWKMMSQRCADSYEDSGSSRYNDPNAGAYRSGTKTISNAAMEQVEALILSALKRDFDPTAPYFANVSIGAYTTKGKGGNQLPIVVPLTAQEAGALQALMK